MYVQTIRKSVPRNRDTDSLTSRPTLLFGLAAQHDAERSSIRTPHHLPVLQTDRHRVDDGSLLSRGAKEVQLNHVGLHVEGSNTEL